MEAAALRHARVEDAGEKAPVAVEPSLCLEKREKEQAGAALQRHFGTLVCRAPTACLGGQLMHAALECTVEPPVQRLAPEQLHPARVNGQVRRACPRNCGERCQRFRVAIVHVRTFDEHRRDAVRGPAARRADRQHRGLALHRRHDPQDVWCSRREASRQRRGEFGECCAGRELDDERAQCAGTDVELCAEVPRVELQ